MGGFRVLAGVLAGLCLGLAIGWLLWKQDTSVPAPDTWAGSLWETEAVLVIAVETAGNLEVVRRAVSPERIVASSQAGFAVEPQRLVVTKLESAGQLLARAGWQDRPLEILHVGPRVRDAAPIDERLASVASLMNKPTLTRGEAYRLLGTL